MVARASRPALRKGSRVIQFTITSFIYGCFAFRSEPVSTLAHVGRAPAGSPKFEVRSSSSHRFVRRSLGPSPLLLRGWAKTDGLSAICFGLVFTPFVCLLLTFHAFMAARPPERAGPAEFLLRRIPLYCSRRRPEPPNSPDRKSHANGQCWRGGRGFSSELGGIGMEVALPQARIMRRRVQKLGKGEGEKWTAGGAAAPKVLADGHQIRRSKSERRPKAEVRINRGLDSAAKPQPRQQSITAEYAEYAENQESASSGRRMV